MEGFCLDEIPAGPEQKHGRTTRFDAGCFPAVLSGFRHRNDDYIYP